MGVGGVGDYSVRERLFESLVEYLLREPLKTPVEVAADGGFGSLIWQSGKVPSRESCIVSVPLLAAFFIASKQFIAGLVSDSVKM
ncbi:MAG: hypothetical protein LBF63_06780 [Treponema sp.]|jgi:hypothetical protein|nr:hypothetical protein [Treponema sp.]